MRGDSSGITVVPVVNQAGSSGKTTTVVTLAALLAQGGARVLVIDLDGQANATTWLGVDPNTVSPSIADVLLRRATLTESDDSDEHAGCGLGRGLARYGCCSL